MVGKIKKNKYQILELIIIFIMTLLFNLMCNELSCDEIWNYGFAYNISNGLLPYKDFNMVITPLFPLLGSFVLTLFGKNLLIYHIFNSVICTGLFYKIKQRIPKAYFIPYAILLWYSQPSYNVFSMLLLYILIDLEEKKSNDYLIGLIIGITFLTKQNIGLFMFLPSLLTKDIKKISKRIIGILFTSLLLTIYLITNNIFYEFIDYTILGIGSFATNNTYMYVSCFIILIIGTIYLIYKYIKTKRIECIYLLCFQMIAFPLIEPYHTMIAIIPTLGFYISNLKLNKKMIKTAFIIFIICNFVATFSDFNLHKYEFLNDTNEYKYRKMSYNDDIAIKNIVNYIKSSDEKTYIISGNAYFIKLEANIKINKYDLLNNGNLGKNGEQKIIKEIKKDCNNQNCRFLIGIEELSNNPEVQYNKEIIKFIMNNYEQTDTFLKYLIYQNY